MHAALFLILSLLGVAGFYILLSSEFLALVQVLVYGGAVAMIILFGLMLTRAARPAERGPTAASGRWPVAALSSWSRCSSAVLDTDWPRDAGEVTTGQHRHPRRRPLPRLAAALRDRLRRAARGARSAPSSSRTQEEGEA